MTDDSTLILASSSPYKRRLMRRLGIDFVSQSADVDEERLPDESPHQMARRLAKTKARKVAAKNPEAWVIGGDQVAALDDRIFGKPGSRTGAIDQLKALQGRTHQLITAVALAHPKDGISTATSTYEMAMRRLTAGEIATYVDEDNPVDCAGAYKIEEAGIRLFEATRGDDPTAIEGLPLTKVWTLLLDAGWP